MCYVTICIYYILKTCKYLIRVYNTPLLINPPLQQNLNKPPHTRRHLAQNGTRLGHMGRPMSQFWSHAPFHHIFGHFVSPEERQTQVENSGKTEKTTAGYSSVFD